MLSRRTKLLNWNDYPDPTTTTSGGGGDGGGGGAVVRRRRVGGGGGGEDSPFDEPPLEDETNVRRVAATNGKLSSLSLFEEENADTHDGRIIVHNNKTQNYSPPRRRNNKNNNNDNKEEEEKTTPPVASSPLSSSTPVTSPNDEIIDDVDDWEKFGSKFPRRNRFDAAAAAAAAGAADAADAAAKKTMMIAGGLDVDVDIFNINNNSNSNRRKRSGSDDFPDPPIAIDQSLSFETNSTTTTSCSEDSENYKNTTVTTEALAAAHNTNTIANGGGTGTSAQQQQQHSPNTATTATTATGADDVDGVDFDDVDDLFANTGCTNLFSFSGIENNGGPVVHNNGLAAKAAAAATGCPTMPVPIPSAVVSSVDRNATDGGEKGVGDTHQTSSSGLKNAAVPSSSSSPSTPSWTTTTSTMTPEDVYNRLTEFPTFNSSSKNTIPGTMMFCQQDGFCKTASSDDISPFPSGLCNSNSNTTTREDPDRRTKLTKRTTTFVSFDRHVHVVVNTPSQEDIDDVLDNYGDDDDGDDGDDDDDDDDVPLSPLGQQGQEQQQGGIAAGCGTPVDFQNVVFDSFDDLHSKLSSVMDKVVSSGSYCNVFESSTNGNAAEPSPEK